MIIALAQSEISEFLETTRAQVFELWRRDTLKRSVFADGRRNPELSHSSVFDVLEFFLRADIMPEATGDEMEIWLSALDEFVEQEAWRNKPFEEMIFDLMEIVADFSGHVPSPETLSRRAVAALAAYFTLLGFIELDAEVA